MARVKLSEVVRSTKRIVTGAATFPALKSIYGAGILFLRNSPEIKIRQRMLLCIRS